MVILLQVRLVIGGTGSRCHKMRNSTKYLMNGTKRDKSPLFIKTSVQSFKLSTFSSQPNQCGQKSVFIRVQIQGLKHLMLILYFFCISSGDLSEIYFTFW